MKKISALVKSGKNIGVILTPHFYQNGYFVVSKTRFEKDYIKLKSESDIPEWLDKGYKLRMSNPNNKNHKSPSLISKKSIQIEC